MMGAALKTRQRELIARRKRRALYRVLPLVLDSNSNGATFGPI